MSANCTIVTCYYRSPAKHSLERYDEWMKNFLTTIPNEMVIFCDEVSASTIASYREKNIDKTKIIILPLYETYCGDQSKHELWIHDWRRDIEHRIHHPNLYIIWNEKAKFVERAIELNPFHTDFFCWCDIGCFRHQEELYLFQQGWPSPTFLQSAQKDKMYFLNITPFEEKDFNILPNGLTHSFEHVTRIGATIFLGHKIVFQEYIQSFYETMNQYIQNDYFTGKDQNIIATLYVLKPELFKMIRPIDGEGDPWFYLQRYFLKEISI